MPVLGHIEISFIETERLDEVGIVEEDRTDLLADRAVNVEPRLHEDESGQRRFAVTDGIAERTPNGRAS